MSKAKCHGDELSKGGLRPPAENNYQISGSATHGTWEKTYLATRKEIDLRLLRQGRPAGARPRERMLWPYGVFIVHGMYVYSMYMV